MQRALVAAAAVAALGVLACSQEEVDPEVVAAGREVFHSEGCVACHGADGEGTRIGPPLDHVSRHWSEPELRRFLADPAGYPLDGRLARLRSRFAARMPAFTMRDQARWKALTGFLMSR